MQYRPSAERTRSRRWRSGTRRNKKHRNAHILMSCPMPKVCLVHRKGEFPRHPAMAMKLTRCEQAWVDDVRAGRIHVHLTQVLPEWQSKLLLLRQKINTARMTASGIVNEYGPPPGSNHLHLHMGVSPSESAGVVTRVRTALQRRAMDISDRWYPRGS